MWILIVITAVLIMCAGFRWSVLSRNRLYCTEHGHDWDTADNSDFRLECQRCGKEV